MNYIRMVHTASLLHDGNVLVAGGSSFSWSLSSVELYNLSTGRWQTMAKMNYERYSHIAVVLRNGHVSVTGGCQGASSFVYCYQTAKCMR